MEESFSRSLASASRPFSAVRTAEANYVWWIVYSLPGLFDEVKGAENGIKNTKSKVHGRDWT